MNQWGERFRVSIFGESHGEGIGIVIDGIPSGTKLDLDKIAFRMKRRAPGRNTLSTQRREADEVKILSGFYKRMTTGTPLCGVIFNTDTRSRDYTPELLRPGHADFTALCKYGESRDFRGGGHFSGRITAPLVFAGAVAQQILSEKGIEVGAHIYSIGNVLDTPFDMVGVDKKTLNELLYKEFPVIDDSKGNEMSAVIEKYRSEKNSVGGTVECAVCGISPGVGSPFFGSVESRISSMMFSVPAVKGIEFGLGFRFAETDGKYANDEFYTNGEKIMTYTNHNGGINGGITNGMPIVFRTALKPTPSIASEQRTVDISKMENTKIEIKGRHDPCIVHRAVPVIEAAAAIAILDMIL